MGSGVQGAAREHVGRAGRGCVRPLDLCIFYKRVLRRLVCEHAHKPSVGPWAPFLGFSKGTVWGSFADIHSPNLGVSFFNAWKQLIYVYDGSVSNASIYVNGSLIGTSQAGAMINTDFFNTANTILRIGDRGDGRGLAGIGTAIDDISIYNRALNTSEAQQLYQIESVPEPSALSLLAVGLGGLALVRRRRS